MPAHTDCRCRPMCSGPGAVMQHNVVMACVVTLEKACLDYRAITSHADTLVSNIQLQKLY